MIKGLIVEEEDKKMLVQRIEDSDRALTLGGPFPGDNLDFKSTVIVWGLIILFLTLPAFAWAYFLNRDVKKIERASGRFSAGDHAARVKVSRISSVTHIAASFNHMAEKSQKLLDSQKELSNSVSHEIRTPLSRFKFSLEMVLDSIPENFHEKSYLSGIGKDVEEIETLVDEMLTYAKFEREPEFSGSLTKNEMVTWLKALIHSEQKALQDKNIIFKIKPEADRFVTLFEPVYLGWAVRNLIRNAAKYAEETVEIQFEPGQDICTILVDDDGPGIPETSRNKVFEPFFRMDKSRHRASGGYGLGLAIAHRIVTWHKGSVSVSESPLKGARFTLTLPVSS